MRKIFNLFLVFVLMFSLLATVAMAQGDTLDNILKRGIIKVSFCVDVPPWKFRDQNGEPAGICADFAKALARDLGVKLEYVFSDWAGIIPMLLSGRSDVVIGDVSITLERAKKVVFTDFWYSNEEYIVVQSDSKWTSWKDMNAEGVKLGSILGSLGVDIYKAAFPKATTMLYNSWVEMKLALEQGRTDGFSAVKLLAQRIEEESNGKLRLIPDPIIWSSLDRYAFCVRPDDIHFLLWLNLWLEHLKNSGELEKFENYWYTDEWRKDYPAF